MWNETYCCWSCVLASRWSKRQPTHSSYFGFGFLLPRKETREGKSTEEFLSNGQRRWESQRQPQQERSSRAVMTVCLPAHPPTNPPAVHPSALAVTRGLQTENVILLCQSVCLEWKSNISGACPCPTSPLNLQN